MQSIALKFDRRVSDTLLEAIKSGSLSPLRAIRSEDPALRDLQLRANPWGSDNWVSLYLGLSTVLDVHERDGLFWLKTHPTYAAAGFDSAWATKRRNEEELEALWPDVEKFLSNVIPNVKPMFTGKEGRVHVSCALGTRPSTKSSIGKPRPLSRRGPAPLEGHDS